MVHLFTIAAICSLNLFARAVVQEVGELEGIGSVS